MKRFEQAFRVFSKRLEAQRLLNRRRGFGASQNQKPHPAGGNDPRTPMSASRQIKSLWVKFYFLQRAGVWWEILFLWGPGRSPGGGWAGKAFYREKSALKFSNFAFSHDLPPCIN